LKQERTSAMRNNPGLPNLVVSPSTAQDRLVEPKDEAASLPEFAQKLNAKLQVRLRMTS